MDRKVKTAENGKEKWERKENRGKRRENAAERVIGNREVRENWDTERRGAGSPDSLYMPWLSEYWRRK